MTHIGHNYRSPFVSMKDISMLSKILQNADLLSKKNDNGLWIMKYGKSHLDWHFRKNLPKIKSQISNASVEWNMTRRRWNIELWFLEQHSKMSLQVGFVVLRLGPTQSFKIWVLKITFQSYFQNQKSWPWQIGDQAHIYRSPNNSQPSSQLLYLIRQFTLPFRLWFIHVCHQTLWIGDCLYSGEESAFNKYTFYFPNQNVNTPSKCID